MKLKTIAIIVCIFFSSASLRAQHMDHHPDPASSLPVYTNVEAQPLLAQALRLEEALNFLGSSLSAEDAKKLKAMATMQKGPERVKAIQSILDPYCLALVDINPESRVKVVRGAAAARLSQAGWTSFLVKIHNEASVTAKLEVESSNAAPLLHISSSEPRMKPEHALTQGQVENRFLEISIYRNRPMLENLSGLNLEYAILQIYSKDAGQREADISFNVGQGSQDIGFRNSINLLFNIRPSTKVVLKVKDEGGSPTMASFLITDGIERILEDTVKDIGGVDYRVRKAQQEYLPFFGDQKTWIPSKELKGIYPLPSRRAAAYDEYPDFFFQPQIYRSDGEHVQLPPGKYKVVYTRGPEYIPQTKEIVVTADKDSTEFSFQLKRWINMSTLGWYSADHHVHAAGCSHYESPEEGVPPVDMWRQALGEDLNVAAVLTWGPSWYHQKSYFTGNVDALSTKQHLMRYDVEVSGFPSSHAGHIVLLRLKEDDYPGTTTIEEWPSWTLPILKWAKSQGGIVGYAHSGWGLQPIISTDKLPNLNTPAMDNIGANEYIVTVTEDAVDFYSAGDTPAPWELNMWYHTLNCGFRTRLSGETDFPCIFDERVGIARSYFKSNGPLTYDAYVQSIREGRSYVSDGGSHIIDFKADGIELGTVNSELMIDAPRTVQVTAKVAAYLPEMQTESGAVIAHRPFYEQPYWNIERSRIGKSRKVLVELLQNGKPAASQEIEADGSWKNLSFQVPISSSSWIAIRIYQSSHTNPIFILVDKKPIRVTESAKWCREAVDQCWKMKSPKFRESEKAEAKSAYDRAASIYDKIIQESSSQ